MGHTWCIYHVNALEARLAGALAAQSNMRTTPHPTPHRSLMYSPIPLLVLELNTDRM